MKLKLSVTSIGAAVACVLAIVSMALFTAAYNGCYGYLEMQFASLPYVTGYGIGTIIAALAIIILPMLEVEGIAKTILEIIVDVCTVLVCVFLCLIVVYVAKASVYEMALTWGSELHINETYMLGVCAKALVSIILSVVGMLVMGISACITKNIYAK